MSSQMETGINFPVSNASLENADLLKTKFNISQEVLWVFGFSGWLVVFFLPLFPSAPCQSSGRSPSFVVVHQTSCASILTQGAQQPPAAPPEPNPELTYLPDRNPEFLRSLTQVGAPQLGLLSSQQIIWIS